MRNLICIRVLTNAMNIYDKAISTNHDRIFQFPLLDSCALLMALASYDGFIILYLLMIF